MSDKIKLSELKNARVGMSKPEHYMHCEDDTYRSFEIIGQDMMFYMDNSCDARGIVATVKAADALIELAEAAKAIQGEGWDFRSKTMDRVLAALVKFEP